MADKDYYDDNLTTDQLIFQNLLVEAEHTVKEIKSGTKLLRKVIEKNELQE